MSCVLVSLSTAIPSRRGVPSNTPVLGIGVLVAMIRPSMNRAILKDARRQRGCRAASVTTVGRVGVIAFLQGLLVRRSLAYQKSFVKGHKRQGPPVLAAGTARELAHLLSPMRCGEDIRVGAESWWRHSSFRRGCGNRRSCLLGGGRRAHLFGVRWGRCCGTVSPKAPCDSDCVMLGRSRNPSSKVWWTQQFY